MGPPSLTGFTDSKATAARHPRTTLTKSTSGKGGGKAYRSSILAAMSRREPLSGTRERR